MGFKHVSVVEIEKIYKNFTFNRNFSFWSNLFAIKFSSQFRRWYIELSFDHLNHSFFAQLFLEMFSLFHLFSTQRRRKNHRVYFLQQSRQTFWEREREKKTEKSDWYQWIWVNEYHLISEAYTVVQAKG